MWRIKQNRQRAIKDVDKNIEEQISGGGEHQAGVIGGYERYRMSRMGRDGEEDFEVREKRKQLKGKTVRYEGWLTETGKMKVLSVIGNRGTVCLN